MSKTPSPDEKYSIPEALSMNDVKKNLHAQATQVEVWLAKCLHIPTLPAGLQKAMEYSLLAGGKRLRPVLCLTTAKLFGLTQEIVMPFAGAIECIHTYSLIHDDLPAMDDDALRRGKPTNHMQFDEATAILAGDALLTDAFFFMSSLPNVTPDTLLRALTELAFAAGSSGMVGGQFLDMQYTTEPNIAYENLANMHAMKTGALLESSCVCGALLAGAPKQDIVAIRIFGKNFGVAFQIMDDILDEIGTTEELGKNIGQDKVMQKTTYVSLFGLEKSQTLAQKHIAQALQALKPYTGKEAILLKGLAQYVINRVS